MSIGADKFTIYWADVLIQVWRLEAIVEPGWANVPTQSRREISFLLGEGSGFCLIQASNWLDEAHTYSGGQSDLLSLLI